LRLGYFCKYLTEFGWKIDAIGCQASSSATDEGLAALIPCEVCVERIQLPGGRFASFRWARAAIGVGRQMIHKHRPSVILSSAPQFVSHIVGNSLAKHSGTPWVVDYGDPFTNNPGYSRGLVGQWLTKRIEQRWVRRASRICLTTHTAIQDYHRTFPETVGKTEYIPLGYEPAEFTELPSTCQEDGLFRLMFAGSLHLNTSDGPREFFRAIVQACRARPGLANRLRVDFIQSEGAREIMSEVVPEGLRRLFSFTPSVPYTEMLTRLNTCTCLLMWGHKGGLQVPSKIYIYFGLKKPVLAVCCDRNDPLRSLVLDHHRGAVASDSAPDIAEQLLHLYDLHVKRELTSKLNLGEVPEYMWQSITSRLNLILRHASGAGPNDAKTLSRLTAAAKMSDGKVMH